LLLRLFDRIWDTRKVGGLLSLATIIPIYKRKGKRSEMGNWRPIALTSAIVKILEAIMVDRIGLFLEQTRQLHQNQFGFTKNRRMDEAKFILIEALKSRRKVGTHVAFLDVKAAYDSVWREKLWTVMHELRIQAETQAIIRDMYEQAIAVVKSQNRTSAPWSASVGLLQGAPLSPVLYTIFVNELVRKLNSMNAGIQIGKQNIAALYFADDIVLLAPSKHKLQLLLNEAQSFAQRNRYRFNADKSIAVRFGGPELAERPNKKDKDSDGDTTKPWDIKVTIGGETIPAANDGVFKYLGTKINVWLDWKDAVNEACNSAIAQSARLAAVGLCGHDEPATAANIFSHFLQFRR
jgi:hypothetical protein